MKIVEEENTIFLSREEAEKAGLSISEEALEQAKTLHVFGGDPQRTLLEIGPDGKIFVGEDRVPLEKIIQGLKDGLAALEVIQEQWGSSPEGT